MRESKEAKLNGEKTMEKTDEEKKEDWIQDHLKDLKEDFIRESFDAKSEEFKEYCENRWSEDVE